MPSFHCDIAPHFRRTQASGNVEIAGYSEMLQNIYSKKKNADRCHRLVAFATCPPGRNGQFAP